jgi:hypothetical protein
LLPEYQDLVETTGINLAQEAAAEGARVLDESTTTWDEAFSAAQEQGFNDTDARLFADDIVGERGAVGKFSEESIKDELTSRWDEATIDAEEARDMIKAAGFDTDKYTITDEQLKESGLLGYHMPEEEQFRQARIDSLIRETPEWQAQEAERVKTARQEYETTQQTARTLFDDTQEANSRFTELRNAARDKGFTSDWFSGPDQARREYDVVMNDRDSTPEERRAAVDKLNDQLDDWEEIKAPPTTVGESVSDVASAGTSDVGTKSFAQRLEEKLFAGLENRANETARVGFREILGKMQAENLSEEAIEGAFGDRQ